MIMTKRYVIWSTCYFNLLIKWYQRKLKNVTRIKCCVCKDKTMLLNFTVLNFLKDMY